MGMWVWAFLRRRFVMGLAELGMLPIFAWGKSEK